QRHTKYILHQQQKHLGIGQIRKGKSVYAAGGKPAFSRSWLLQPDFALFDADFVQVLGIKALRPAIYLQFQKVLVKDDAFALAQFEGVRLAGPNLRQDLL